MSLISCSILVSQQAQVLLISKALYKLLQIDVKNPIQVRLGSNTIQVRAKVSGISGKTLAMPMHVAIALKLPISGKCNVKSIADGIQIGPLIGVLTDDIGPASQVSGPRSSYIRRFIRTHSTKALYIVFSPHNVNWREQTITGYVPRANGGWIRKTVPLPDVVYNRFLNRRVEKSEKMEAFKEKFIRLQIPIFNWNFLTNLMFTNCWRTITRHPHMCRNRTRTLLCKPCVDCSKSTDSSTSNHLAAVWD